MGARLHSQRRIGLHRRPGRFGVDMYAGLGIKLDSSPERSGSALLPGAYNRAGGPRNADPRSVDEYTEATAAVKM